LDMLSAETRDEVLVACSASFEGNYGMLEISKRKMKESLPREQFQEVCQINSKVYQLGTVEFEKFAAQTQTSAVEEQPETFASTQASAVQHNTFPVFSI
jgi:hypothetical protein